MKVVGRCPGCNAIYRVPLADLQVNGPLYFTCSICKTGIAFHLPVEQVPTLETNHEHVNSSKP